MKIVSANLFNWENIYILFISLSLISHIFNNLEVAGGIKLFYIFVGCSIVSVISLIRRTNVIKKYLILYLFFSIVSCFYATYTGAFERYFSVFLVMLSTFGLSLVDKNKVVFLNLLLSPIVLLGLFYTLIHYPAFRFQGFYNDPNYLCSSLQVYTFLILLILPKSNKWYIRVWLLLQFFIIILLVLSTLSRTGLICMFVVTLAAFSSYITKSKKMVFVFIIALFGFFYFQQNSINNFVNSMNRRADSQNDLVESAAETRFQLSIRGIEYVKDNPEFAMFGVGLGGIRKIREISSFDHQIDHNTFTSCFTEQGILALISLVCILYAIAYRLYKCENSFIKNFHLLSFLSFILFSLSINMMIFLPFWWIVFLMFPRNKSNKFQINHISSTHLQIQL